MLIRVPEHTPRDLLEWELAAKRDPIVAQLDSHKRHVARAQKAIRDFAALGSCYAGTSWGKDSTVLAHLIVGSGLRIPLVWVRVEPVENPHCLLVRDSFLAAYPEQPYDEIVTWCRSDGSKWIPTGRLTDGFATAAKRYGERHISGIRAEESSPRKTRCRHYGENSKLTSAPLAWWSGDDVFSYLHTHELPVHPAYAMSLGGCKARERIRVASLGGERGEEFGRKEWEWTYYREAMQRIERLAREANPTPARKAPEAPGGSAPPSGACTPPAASRSTARGLPGAALPPYERRPRRPA